MTAHANRFVARRRPPVAGAASCGSSPSGLKVDIDPATHGGTTS